MKKSESISKFATAMAKAHAEMPAVNKNSTNPFLKNKYADLGAVIEVSRPVLAKHELTVMQSPVNEGDKIGVTTLIIHSSGEYIEDTIYLPASDSKGLSVAQSAGVVISYLRRYALQSFLNMYADEDTDGHKPEQQKPAQPAKNKRAQLVERMTDLMAKAAIAGIDVKRFEITDAMNEEQITALGKELSAELKNKEGK